MALVGSVAFGHETTTRADVIPERTFGMIQAMGGCAVGWSWTTPWVQLSIALYIMAGICWLPVVWLQAEMAKMAAAAHADGAKTLPIRYWRFALWWERLGYPAFIAMVVVYFLMVLKPAL